MASPETVVTPVAQARTEEGRFANSDRLFYVIAAVLMLIVHGWGISEILSARQGSVG